MPPARCSVTPVPWASVGREPRLPYLPGCRRRGAGCRLVSRPRGGREGGLARGGGGSPGDGAWGENSALLLRVSGWEAAGQRGKRGAWGCQRRQRRPGGFWAAGMLPSGSASAGTRVAAQLAACLEFSKLGWAVAGQQTDISRVWRCLSSTSAYV